MMTPKRPTSSIRTGDINNKNGKVIVAGGNVAVTETTTTQSLSFAEVYQRIDAHTKISPGKKADLKAEVAEVEAAVKKPQVDENTVARHLRNIGRMAPDIMEVALAAILNPAAGLGLVAGKIAAKAKEK